MLKRYFPGSEVLRKSDGDCRLGIVAGAAIAIQRNVFLPSALPVQDQLESDSTSSRCSAKSRAANLLPAVAECVLLDVANPGRLGSLSREFALLRMAAKGAFSLIGRIDYCGVRQKDDSYSGMEPSATPETPPRPFNRLALRPVTAKELQILRLLGQNLRNKQISIDAAIAQNTVKVHLRRIFQKLGVSTRGDAVIVARQRGLID